jgi:hypothetical protein
MDGQTDGWTDMTKLTVIFHTFVNVPKKGLKSSARSVMIVLKTANKIEIVMSEGDGRSSESQNIPPNRYVTKNIYFAKFSTVCSHRQTTFDHLSRQYREQHVVICDCEG